MTPLDLTLLKSFQAHISKENQADFMALCDRLVDELGWKTIDSAPKSEKTLIFTPEIGIETAILLEATDTEGKPAGDQWFVGQSMKNGGATCYKPTHWMPLPPEAA